MLETTRIRKEGYAIRPTFEEFVERYKTLAAQVTMAGTAANCRKILTSSKLQDYQIGKTKVFLKYWHVDRLIELLEVVHKAASTIQKCESTCRYIVCIQYLFHMLVVRGFICRRRFKKLLEQLRKEASQVAEFTANIAGPVDAAYQKLKLLNAADAKRPKGQSVSCEQHEYRANERSVCI